LWGLSALGTVAVLPYATTLQARQLLEASTKMSIPVRGLIAISVVQTLLLLAVAVVAGSYATRRIGLASPVLDAVLSGTAISRDLKARLRSAALLGVVCGIVLIGLDAVFMTYTPSMQVLDEVRLPWWQGFLASFYGGICEEVLLRWFLMAVIALGLRRLINGRSDATPASLPASTFWIANGVTAVVFGLGHLPATAAVMVITPAVVMRAVVSNGLAGLLFGWQFRRSGIESAMASHWSADICVHVAAPLIAGG
jgi:membrane protease YdiL (CAAX protease family)